jgi:hypothetical protein
VAQERGLPDSGRAAELDRLPAAHRDARAVDLVSAAVQPGQVARELRHRRLALPRP